MQLSKEETKRYARHLLLNELGTEGQLKLKQAKVLVIGAGGLGCPVLQYLTAAGVGTIGVVEFDVVDETNLQRQILYTVEDVGKPKIECAIGRLSKQNNLVKFIPYPYPITNKNALNIIKEYDVVIDGTDNFSTRYMVNDACVILNKTLVYGSISRFEGQVSVFNYPHKSGLRSPSYRCLFPEPPSPENSPNCSEVGVLGVLPGIIGSMQANEAIKIISGIGEVLSGKLFMMNVLNMETYTVAYASNPEVMTFSPEEFEEMDYDYFCNSFLDEVNEITALQLKGLLHKSNNIQLLDVREINEYPQVESLSDLKIPFNQLLKHADKISSEKQVIVFCKSGARSKAAIQQLKKEIGFNNLYNLKGGVDAWLNLIHD
jgi:molybdopterin/thiamine biosynthesis adenylyltransferase/rhodanese-related sulfurtransferase